jgi:tRNA-dihydrouridine synthase 1
MKPSEQKSLLAYSPMLHARLFQDAQKKYRENSFQPTRSGLASPLPHDHMQSEPSSGWYLDGRPDVDRPLTVQFCANEPDELLAAAKFVQPYCDAVDLNLGCPQGIARKGRYGAFLQEDWDLIFRLINKLHTGLDIPVTAKIRVQETREKTLDYARMILRAGASILTVHGRQREQKGHKTGLADWSMIRYLRDHLPQETVIFANGNILRHEDIETCLQETGADGVMSAEGNLYDPTIFAGPPEEENSREYWRGRDGKGGYRMDAVLRRYLDIIYEYVLEEDAPRRAPLFVPNEPEPTETADTELAQQPADGSLKRSAETMEQPASKRQKQDKPKTGKQQPANISAMQPHLFHFLRPLISVHTEVRDALAKSKRGNMEEFENVLRLTEAAVKEGMLDYEQSPGKYDEGPDDETETKGLATEKGGEGERDGSLVDYESSLKAVKACKRPWWVCQPHVRPLPKEALEKGSITLSRKEREKLQERKDEERGEERVRAQTLEGGGEATSAREKRDVEAGLENEPPAAQAMVAG